MGFLSLRDLRESGKELRAPASIYPGPIYKVSSLSHGLMFTAGGKQAEIATVFHAAVIAIASLRYRNPRLRHSRLQASGSMCTPLVSGADNHADDTAALQRAIDTHRVLYFPSGTLPAERHGSSSPRLRADRSAIPARPQLDLPDGTHGFEGPGAPRPLLLAPAGGATQVRGLGLFTGGLNGRAVCASVAGGTELSCR